MPGSVSWGARPHVLTSSPLEEPPPVGTSRLGLRLRRALLGETRTFCLHPSPSRDAVPSRWRWPPPEAVPPATPCPLMDGCALPVCGASLAQPTLRGPRARRLDVGCQTRLLGTGTPGPRAQPRPCGGAAQSPRGGGLAVREWRAPWGFLSVPPERCLRRTRCPPLQCQSHNVPVPPSLKRSTCGVFCALSQWKGAADTPPGCSVAECPWAADVRALKSSSPPRTCG